VEGNRTAKRPLAVLCGIIFILAALYILLEDAIFGRRIAIEHVLTVVTLFGTVAAGHLAIEAARHRCVGASLGFAVLFVSGTAMTVYNSVGRQAESSDAKLLSVEVRNDQIAAVRKSRSTNSAMLADARIAHARECASGRGKRCDGILATIRVYEDAVKGNEADLARLGPPLPVAPKAEKMAAFAAIFGADKAQAKATLMLIEPFAYTLFFELGSIISLGYGFGRKPSSRADVVASGKVRVATHRQRLPDSFQTRGTSKTVAEQDLRRRLATGETVSAQDELAERWQVNKGTVSKWVSEWERNGRIPARQTAGRCKTITRH